MSKTVFSSYFRRSAVAIAVGALCAAALAETSDAQTTISAGVGAVSGSKADHGLFGQYNGLGSERNAVGTLGIDYSRRNQEAGQWVDFKGSELLGNTRELDLVWKNPGNWKLKANYGELTRYEPLTVGGASDTELKTKRTSLGLGLTKIISPALQFALDLKSENKEGARLFGIGMNCPSLVAPSCGANTGWALLMLPEPINANHSQVEARVSYALDKLRMNLGYYGSFYRNANDTLNPNLPGSLSSNAALIGILNQPLALAPDNQAHQFDLSGSFDFMPGTRATFKFGRASATQTADFAASGLTGAPAGVTNLGGDVTTKMAKVGLTSRPVAQLYLLADWRYADKDDRTPIALYNSEGAATYTNQNFPNRKTNGKLQASWQFTSDYRGTLVADVEAIDRGAFTASSAVSGLSALRQKTDEKSVRAELRGRISEAASATLSVSSSRRNGSNWLKDNNGLGVTEVTDVADPVAGLASTAIFMPTLADRKRDKVKLFANWQPSEALALQFSAEGGKDQFDTPGVYGLRDTRMNQFSVDWSYALSDAWGMTGYLSRGIQGLNQARPAGYIMAFDNTNLGASIGVAGKASAKLDVGGSLVYVNDKNVYAQTLDAWADGYSAALLASSGGLPDIVYRQTALKLFGKYALDKTSLLRVDFVHQRASFNDWAWGAGGVPFAYSDGTTVTQQPTQNVSFVGVTYIYQLH